MIAAVLCVVFWLAVVVATAATVAWLHIASRPDPMTRHANTRKALTRINQGDNTP